MKHSHTDSLENLLVAKRRELAPLATESAQALSLDSAQGERMEFLLSEAWLLGTLVGGAKALAEVAGKEAEQPNVDEQLQPLVEAALELGLSLPATIAASKFLTRAILAGARAAEAETIALAIEHNHDLSEEALEWIARGESSGEGSS